MKSFNQFDDECLKERRGVGAQGVDQSTGVAASAASRSLSANSVMPIRISVLTGGRDRPYALGLAASLVGEGIWLDFVGSEEVDGPELHGNPAIEFLNLRGDQKVEAPLVRKVFRVLFYYCRLIHYAAFAKTVIFHILWNSKFEWFDRTLLIWYYRMLGKRIALTVHNVNAGKRDGNDSLLNRLTLRAQYHAVQHIFVHTERMKVELQKEFGVAERKISVIPFGINDTVPNTSLGKSEARSRLGVSSHEKVILFFGNIAPYKGLEFLVEAMSRIQGRWPDSRLIIAGRPKGSVSYWEDIERRIDALGLGGKVTKRIEYVPDDQTEVFFKAADVLVLPYTTIFQSGVLFLGYNFGLPVIASDVGSLGEDVVEGKTGFVCRPRDSEDLAAKIDAYFTSDLFADLEERREGIQQLAAERNSWTKAARRMVEVYEELGLPHRAIKK